MSQHKSETTLVAKSFVIRGGAKKALAEAFTEVGLVLNDQQLDVFLTHLGHVDHIVERHALRRDDGLGEADRADAIKKALASGFPHFLPLSDVGAHKIIAALDKDGFHITSN